MKRKAEGAARGFTREQAIAMYKAEVWREWTDHQRAEFQLTAKLLVMPMDVFHRAVEKALGRPVYTHEFAFAWDDLLRELMGERPTPTLREVLDLIPAEKCVILVVHGPAADDTAGGP